MCRAQSLMKCDFPALPVKMRLNYTGSSLFKAQDDPLVLRLGYIVVHQTGASPDEPAALP